MKIKNLLISFVLLATVSIRAQESKSWTPVLISFDGTNGFNGVEAWSRLSTCNNSPVVLIKLVNNNEYSVKATWINLIQTNDNRDLYAPGQVSINLPPKSEKAGTCGDVSAELIIKLSDIGIMSDNFKALTGSNFDAVKRDNKIQTNTK